MKTSTIPSIRVKPELRQAAERLLKNGETLSNFIEQSLQLNIEKRIAQSVFLERGFAARDQARQSGEYFSADQVISELEELLENAENAECR